MLFSKSLLHAAAVLPLFAAAQTCVVESLPDPLVNTSYPFTGTVNGTVVILPISYKLARSIIPAEFPILTMQIEAWLPWFPKDQYPVCHRLIMLERGRGDICSADTCVPDQAMLQANLDHDLHAAGGPPGPGFDFTVRQRCTLTSSGSRTLC